MDEADRKTVAALRSRQAATEFLLEHMFAWMVLRDGADGDAILDDLARPGRMRLPVGTLMDASRFSEDEERLQQHLQELVQKLRERYHEVRDLRAE